MFYPPLRIFQAKDNFKNIFLQSLYNNNFLTFNRENSKLVTRNSNLAFGLTLEQAVIEIA